MMGLAGKLMGGGTPSMISFVSAASATASTVGMPEHQAGDLLVVYAFNAASSSIITTASGWTSRSANLNSTLGISYRLAYKIAESGSETTGDWVNATDVVVHVYRGTAQVGPIGPTITNGILTTTTTTLTFRNLGADDPRGNSWIGAFAGTTGNTGVNIATPPTGMVNRTSAVGASNSCVGHDSNSVKLSWPTTTVSLNQTVKPFTIVYEIVSA